MSVIDVLSSPLGERLALVLLHFLWQGLVVAVLFWGLTVLLRLRRAESRYALALGTMVVLAACPMMTFAWLTANRLPVAASPTVEAIRSDVAPGGDDEIHGEVGSRESGSAERSSRRQLADQAAASPNTVQPTAKTSAALATSWPSWTQTLAQHRRTVQPWLLAVWMIGVGLLAGRLLLSTLGIARWKRSRRPLPELLRRRADVLTGRMGVSRAIGVFTSGKIHEAVVVGLLRPMVLLPACWVSELPPQILEAVLAHELAHVRRFDLWVNLFQRLVETLLFFHPAVWWLSSRLRTERELCCDELAVLATGQRLVYADALHQVARRRSALVGPALAAGIGGRKKMALLSRVRNVLQSKPNSQRSRLWPAGLLALIAPLGVWAFVAQADPTGTAVAQEEDERERRQRGERREGDRERREGDPEERARRIGEHREFDRRRDREHREGEPRGADRRRDRERPEGDRDRRFGDRRPEGEGSRRPNPGEAQLFRLVMQLRAEVQQLREEVARLRGDRPRAVGRPVHREGDRPNRRDDDRLQRREGDSDRFNRLFRRDGERRPDDQRRLHRDGDREERREARRDRDERGDGEREERPRRDRDDDDDDDDKDDDDDADDDE